MTREEYKALIEANYPDRWDLHQVMLAQWDQEHGTEPPAPQTEPEQD